MADKKVLGNFRNRERDISKVNFENINNPFNFYSVLLNSSNIIKWLMDNGLMKCSMICPKCFVKCTLNNRDRATDGKTWRCTKNNNHEYSIRKFSFFSNIKYSIQDSLVFIREMVLGSNLKKACLNSGVAYGHTACDYSNFIRDLYKEFVYNLLKTFQLSGVIEIDESLFGRKIKYHRGAKKNQQLWIFGKFTIIYILHFNFITCS